MHGKKINDKQNLKTKINMFLLLILNLKTIFFIYRKCTLDHSNKPTNKENSNEKAKKTILNFYEH